MIHTLLAPFRILLIFVATLICGTVGVLMRLFGASTDITVMVISHKVWGPFVNGITGMRVEVHGMDQVDLSTPSIYCANHSSLMDIPAICANTRFPLYFVAKESLKKVPGLGWYVTVTGMIFINRSNREQAMQSMKRAAELIKNGKNVLTFPEGSRSADGELQMFRRGSFIIALEGDIPVVPIALEKVSRVLPKGGWVLKPGKVRMTVGQPLYPSSLPERTPEAFAAATKEAVAALMQNNKA